VFSFNLDQFDLETVARMAEHLTVLVEAAVAAPPAPLARLSLVSAAETEVLLEGWNADVGGWAASATAVHDLFEAHARRSPDALALWFEGRTLTYRELDARANQLARRLVSNGVGPDDIVGICVHRSIEVIVAILAAMKAGGAYTPLDPASPAARMRQILADGRVRVVVTEATHRGLF